MDKCVCLCCRQASRMCQIILHSGRKLIQHSHTEGIKRLTLTARQAQITLRERERESYERGEVERLSSWGWLFTGIEFHLHQDLTRRIFDLRQKLKTFNNRGTDDLETPERLRTDCNKRRTLYNKEAIAVLFSPETFSGFGFFSQ